MNPPGSAPARPAPPQTLPGRGQSTAPRRVAVLRPEDFKPSWPQIPRGPMQVGIMPLGLVDHTEARAYAAKAMKAFPGPELIVQRIDAGNDALGVWMVARGTCKPDDMATPWMKAAELNIPLALRPETVRFLWDEIEKLSVETSPLARRATSEDLVRLGARLLPLEAIVARVLQESARLDSAEDDSVTLVGPAREQAIVRALSVTLPELAASPLSPMSIPDRVRAEKFLAMVLDELEGNGA